MWLLILSTKRNHNINILFVAENNFKNLYFTTRDLRLVSIYIKIVTILWDIKIIAKKIHLLDRNKKRFGVRESQAQQLLLNKNFYV